MSQGGAYAHNLFAGRIKNTPEPRRDTPWQEEHGTKIAGLSTTKGGDNRFYNDIFTGPAGLDGYDKAELPVQMAGNVFLKGVMKPVPHGQGVFNHDLFFRLAKQHKPGMDVLLEDVSPSTLQQSVDFVRSVWERV